MMNLPYRSILLWVLVFFAFIVESTVVHWILPADWSHRVAPHLVLIAVLYIAIFRSRHYALTVGLTFGLLHDLLYYGHMLGVYTFSLGFIGYMSGLAFQKKFITFYYVLLVMAIGCFSFDTIVYFIYRLFRVAEETYQWALVDYILPSLLFNLFCAVLVYHPIRKALEAYAAKRAEEEQD